MKTLAASISRLLRRTQKGQSLVEFALVLPIFLVVVFAIVDFGMGLRGWITITNAAREGARVGAVYAEAGTAGTVDSPILCPDVLDTSTIAGRSCSTAGGLPGALKVGVDGAGGDTGDPVRVKMTYDYDYITPLGAFVTGIVGPLHMETTADMRLE
jgi:Flp pilus assembly protein TadG